MIEIGPNLSEALQVIAVTLAGIIALYFLAR